MNYHAAAASAVKLHVHVYVWAHSQDFLLVVVVGGGGGGPVLSGMVQVYSCQKYIFLKHTCHLYSNNIAAKFEMCTLYDAICWCCVRHELLR